MTARHTLGPWTLKGRTTVMAGERQVALAGFKMGDWPASDYAEEAANARLIAAAPALLAERDRLKADLATALAALRLTLASLDESSPGASFAADKARAALALAEGKPDA